VHQKSPLGLVIRFHHCHDGIHTRKNANLVVRSIPWEKQLMVAITFLQSFLNPKGSKLVPWLLAFLSVCVVTALYYNQNQFLEAFEAKSYDLRFKSLRGTLKATPEIGIIKIDDKSIAELGRFPWSRNQYVKLLDRLSASEAKAVLFDVIFSESETKSVDNAFAEAVKKSGNVGLAVAFEWDKNYQVTKSTHTIPQIEKGAAGIGHINVVLEDDGVIRRNQLLVNVDGRQFPSLGLLGAQMALGEMATAGLFKIKISDKVIPVDEDNRMWVNYMGPPNNYQSFSFVDIVNGQVKPENLKGKILFVGATALGVYDMRVTPFSGNTPGVEIHATIADNILSGRFIRRTGLESLFDIALIFALGLFAFYLTKRLGFYAAFPATLVLSTVYIWFAFWMFQQGHWVSMIYPPLAVIFSLLIGGSFRYLVLERSARELRSIFSSYHSDKLVARLEEDPEAAKIGGDSKDVTIMFTDIKGFTSFSEQHTPQEVVARLNEYLGAMVEVIEEYDGYVDKFIGDGIMAYWGAPLAQENHAELAISCVHAMKNTMEKLCTKWQAEGVEPFAIRAGVQSGEVVAGNVGLRGRKMEYTVIGDTVNQAARLESSAKYYSVDVLVGENTYRQTCDSFSYRELDKIRMVGKQVPVTVYELTGLKSTVEKKLNTQFAAALAIYRQCLWEEAAKSFAAIQAEFADDKPTAIYLERCEYFKKNPAATGWDGVFNRRGK
jgi:adenylate cyclase